MIYKEFLILSDKKSIGNFIALQDFSCSFQKFVIIKQMIHALQSMNTLLDNFHLFFTLILFFYSLIEFNFFLQFLTLFVDYFLCVLLEFSSLKFLFLFIPEKNLKFNIFSYSSFFLIMKVLQLFFFDFLIPIMELIVFFLLDFKEIDLKFINTTF